ncbi:hypothetical protein [Nostoc sp. TCL26-01]|uniref:hypothetical protein n=1 Tax=Nostoc sp. TCL26-01 TaxID=2576904 RepID=UPI0015C12C2A|nr:hypothetical protein [Nostoc sp. TCL26-01]QLE55452.1 hypothetical protein FD725_07935 [Nostoc sp. TCL26-01]
MNRQQWLFEAPLTFSENSIHPKLEVEWEFPEYEYIPSSVRRAFENAVKISDWRSAYLNLNGLNMYEMLRALDDLPSGRLDLLWANRLSFMSMVNMPRIDYARTVVVTRRLPKPIGDLQKTGQVRDAANFIAQSPRKRTPYCNVGGQVACPPPTGLNEAEMTALKVTTRFENDKEFGCRVSQVDGISMGMIQWNLAAGTLQKMLKDFENQTGRLRDFFEADTDKLKNLIALPNKQAVNLATNERLCFRWRSQFLRLCADPDYCRLQTQDIQARIKTSLKITKKLGLRTIRGLSMIFDVHTGDGIRPEKERAFMDRIKGLSTEQEKLVAIADEAARWAGKWADERRQRRMLIAKGTGCYRGHCKWNLNQDYPNLDNLLLN